MSAWYLLPSFLGGVITPVLGVLGYMQYRVFRFNRRYK